MLILTYSPSAERAEGPTTVCHINTLVNEPGTELYFDDDNKYTSITVLMFCLLIIILESSRLS